MKVETKKSNIQVVIMRLRGELAAKLVAVDRPLDLSVFNVPIVSAKPYLTSSILTQAGRAVKYLYGK